MLAPGMNVNPRRIPFMTILGVLGLVIGYLIGQRGFQDPMIPAFWGLCIGTFVALVVRFVLTWRWMKEQNEQDRDPPA